VGASRAGGAPHLTPVYYVLEGDDLLISVTRSRLKTKLIKRNAEVSLCVLGEEQPFPYMLIYGRGTIEEAGAPEVMMRIGERMSGNPLPESVRPAVEDRAQKEGRVVLRVTPERILYAPR
jgi:PPOX class probable F420-dependent enzyme